jgi:hypothetical protein
MEAPSYVRMWAGLISLREGPMVGSFEKRKELSFPIKGREIFERMNGCKLLNEDSSVLRGVELMSYCK